MMDSLYFPNSYNAFPLLDKTSSDLGLNFKALSYMAIAIVYDLAK